MLDGGLESERLSGSIQVVSITLPVDWRGAPGGFGTICGVRVHYPNLWWGRMPLIDEIAVFQP